MDTLETRDWALFPSELLEMIAARLTEIVDRVCFSSVCPQWRSASKSIAHNLPPQIPWLLLPKNSKDSKDSKDTDAITTTRRFFSLSHNRFFAIPLPEYRRTRTNKTFPSPFGRIVVPQGIETLALMNPLTLSSVTLPPLPLTESRRKNIGAFVLNKAKVLASNLVAVTFPHGCDLHLCRLGESSWKRLDMISCDFVYYKGKFFVINSTEGIWVFDVDTLRKVSEIPPVGGYRVRDWLVESFDGALLLVQMTERDGTESFRLFQLDESEEHMKWMEINSIGDNVFFIDGLQAMAFDASDSNGLRGNCIYFVDYLWGPKAKGGIVVFNVGGRKIKELPLFPYNSGYRGKAMWFVPTLC